MFALSSTIRPPLPRKLQDKGSRLTCSKFHFGEAQTLGDLSDVHSDTPLQVQRRVAILHCAGGKRQACKVSASQEGAVQQVSSTRK